MSRLPALLRAPPNPPSRFPGGMPLAAHFFAACLEQRAYVNGSVRRQAWRRSRRAWPSAASPVTFTLPWGLGFGGHIRRRCNRRL